MAEPSEEFFDVSSTPFQGSESPQIAIDENSHSRSSFSPSTYASGSSHSIDRFRNIFESMHRSPTPYLPSFRPSLFFSRTVFHEVYFGLYTIILPLLSLAFLVVNLFEEGPALHFSAITTSVFVAIHFVMFSLETIFFLVTNTLLERIFELSEWVLDLIVLICHIVSVGFAFECSMSRTKLESISRNMVRIGIVVSTIAILLRALFYFHRLFKFAQITKDVECLWVMGLGKSIEKSIISYKHVIEKLRKTKEDTSSVQQLDAMNIAIRGRLMESFYEV